MSASTTDGATRRTNGMVTYRSSALEATAPALAAAADARSVQRVPAVIEANRMAERVREEFKRKGRAKRSKDSKEAPADTEEAEKAGRYDRRLKMNRHSAAASRVRREAYIKALEQQLLEQDDKFNALQRELDAERDAHNRLRLQVNQQPPALRDNASVISSVPSEILASKPAPVSPLEGVSGVLPTDPSSEVNGGATASPYNMLPLPFEVNGSGQITNDSLDFDTMFPTGLQLDTAPTDPQVNIDMLLDPTADWGN